MNWQAIDFIKSFEGCRLQAYQDQKGVWTIGWGATGPEIVKGTSWTQDQADRDLVTRVQNLEAGLVSILTRHTLSQEQITVLIDFSYNLGLEALHGSTLLKLVNSGQDFAAAREFAIWDHVNHNENKGLLIRRLSEALLYTKGIHG